ncbi:MAG: hypothetical protein O9257_00285 [Brevundimonas sp.]|nr:hypothetical protein [Brevundimonas sp.]
MTIAVFESASNVEFRELNSSEVDGVFGGGSVRVGSAAIGAAAAVWGVWVGAFTVGVGIGKDIGYAIFGADDD